MPFFRMFFLPLIAYWILMIIILFLWRDHNRNEHNSESLGKSSGSKKDIFSDKSGNSLNKLSNKTDVKDEYDVDENGNVKGSSKKHRSSNDDDEYVEL